MKNLPLVSGLLYCQPWAIMPTAFDDLTSLYRAYLAGTLPAPRAEMFGETPEQNDDTTTPWVLLPGGVGVVHVAGVITKKPLYAMCGPQFAALSDLDAALASMQRAGAKQIVVNLDTPGGMVTGLAETCMRIEAMRADGVQMFAYTDTQACSAGAWLAACMDGFWAAPSATVGSIGVYQASVDSSKAYEMQGLELKLFREGELKAIGHPGKKWTPTEEAFMAADVAAIGETFRAHMRARRPGITDEMMQGQWFTAADAVPVLVDGLAVDLESFLVSRMQ